MSLAAAGGLSLGCQPIVIGTRSNPDDVGGANFSGTRREEAAVPGARQGMGDGGAGTGTASNGGAGGGTGSSGITSSTSGGGSAGSTSGGGSSGSTSGGSSGESESAVGGNGGAVGAGGNATQTLREAGGIANSIGFGGNGPDALGGVGNRPSGSPGLGGTGGLGNANGLGGATGFGGAVGLGGAALGSGGNRPITPPSEAALAWEPPETGPLTVAVNISGSYFAGTLSGDYFLRMRSSSDWVRANGLFSSTSPSGSRPITALSVSTISSPPSADSGVYPPESSTWTDAGVRDENDSVIWRAGAFGRFWNPSHVYDAVVYGISEWSASGPATSYTTIQVGYTSKGSLFNGNNESWGVYTDNGTNESISAATTDQLGLLSGLWIGTTRGRLYYVPKPENALSTSSWVPFKQTLPNIPVVGLTVDPSDNRRGYVTLASLNPPGIYRTEDGGNSFVALSLPVVPESGQGALSRVSINGADSNTIYVVAFTPSLVVLRSNDHGDTWEVRGRY